MKDTSQAVAPSTPRPSLLSTQQPTAPATLDPTLESDPKTTESPTFDRTNNPTTPAISDNPTSVPTTKPTFQPSVTPTMLQGGNLDINYGLQPDCYEEDPSKFSICLDLASASGEVEDFMVYFAKARDAWERVIVSNDIYYTEMADMARDYTATGNYPSVIDGLYIASNVGGIDGEGGILGSAAPIYYVTFEDGIRRPVTGVMKFDVDDLNNMDENGVLEGVIMHEMGHVLGIGT